MEWFGFLRRLFGGPGKAAPTAPDTLETQTILATDDSPQAPPPGATDYARLNAQLPLQNADGQHSFVRREAILNRAEKIAGYEFSLMTRLKSRLTRRGGTATRAYDSALLARLALHEVMSLLGSRLAFVSLSVESLANATIDRLPRENTVISFEMSAQTTDWQKIAERFARMKELGFSHGIHISEAADVECPLIADSDYVQIDVTAFDGMDLRSLTRKLRQQRPDGRPPLRLVAREVQSDDDYQLCYKCGFDFFQGPFISSHDSLRPTHNTINRMAALPILSMLRTDQSFAAIANQLRNEPTLSYKLLRYLNSAAMGLQQPIDSLTKALVVLGREKFYRWTSLLLFDIENPGYRERLLSERALTRGRTLELLGGKGSIPPLPEQLFLIGLFSLLDQALGRPLPELVQKAALPDVVHDALLGRAGPCRDALALVVLAEADTSAQPEQLAQALASCDITDQDYSPVAAQALVWAHHVLEAGTE
jgi:c-di-GMP phosphodiesterase